MLVGSEREYSLPSVVAEGDSSGAATQDGACDASIEAFQEFAVWLRLWQLHGYSCHWLNPIWVKFLPRLQQFEIGLSEDERRALRAAVMETIVHHHPRLGSATVCTGHPASKRCKKLSDHLQKRIQELSQRTLSDLLLMQPGVFSEQLNLLSTAMVKEDDFFTVTQQVFNSMSPEKVEIIEEERFWFIQLMGSHRRGDKPQDPAAMRSFLSVILVRNIWKAAFPSSHTTELISPESQSMESFEWPDMEQGSAPWLCSSCVVL